MKTRDRWWIVAALLLASCSSVVVPRERFYRLDLPAAGEPDPARGGVLRVQDLQLNTALDSDCLVRQDGVCLEPRSLSRWVAPLDRLVTDALVLGLSRARVCDLVKSSVDPGTETWSLRGRIVEFAETDAGSSARVTMELWLEADARLLFHDEFVAVEAIATPGPEGSVAALSRGLQHVVCDVVARMRGLDLFASARTRAVSGVATPIP